MARRRRNTKKTKSRRKRYSSSEESSSDSDSSLDISSSSSESEESSSDSEDSYNPREDFDESEYLENMRGDVEEELRSLCKENRVLKYEDKLMEKITSFSDMNNCDEKQLKKMGIGYEDRNRILEAFRKHIEDVLEKGRERWERQQELKHSRRTKKKRGKSKSSKSSRSKKKSSKVVKKKSRSKSSRKKTRSKVDPDEALRKLDTGWSGKKQAWADYKQHEARVAELVEFYDEIGKKRTNPEEHARKLILEYPGGIHKLVIALDKKYHHIPYGWEELLEEAERYREAEGNGSSSD